MKGANVVRKGVEIEKAREDCSVAKDQVFHRPVGKFRNTHGAKSGGTGFRRSPGFSGFTESLGY